MGGRGWGMTPDPPRCRGVYFRCHAVILLFVIGVTLVVEFKMNCECNYILLLHVRLLHPAGFL